MNSTDNKPPNGSTADASKKIGLATESLRDPQVLEKYLEEVNKSGIDFVDCAWRYGNEPYIGMALKNLKSRDDKFDVVVPFQSKVWPTKFTGGINKSLKFALQKIGGFTQLDTYFLHKPADSWTTNLTAYKQLIECMNRGQTLKVGLGYFEIDMLERLYNLTQQRPNVLQHNISVNNLNTDVLEYCKVHGIELQAYEPFGDLKSNLKNPLLIELSGKYSTSIKNIILAYLLEVGVVPVVSASDPSEIHELSRSKDLKLDAEDVERIAKLNKYKPRKRKRQDET